MKNDNYGPDVIKDGLTAADAIKKAETIRYVFNENHRTIFTVETTKHNWRYTYRVKLGKEPNYFKIAVWYRPGNGNDYRNIGFVDLDKKLFYTNTFWQLEHTKPVKLFSSFLEVLFNNEPWPEECKFY